MMRLHYGLGYLLFQHTQSPPRNRLVSVSKRQLDHNLNSFHPGFINSFTWPIDMSISQTVSTVYQLKNGTLMYHTQDPFFLLMCFSHFFRFFQRPTGQKNRSLSAGNPPHPAPAATDAPGAAPLPAARLGGSGSPPAKQLIQTEHRQLISIDHLLEMVHFSKIASMPRCSFFLFGWLFGDSQKNLSGITWMIGNVISKINDGNVIPLTPREFGSPPPSSQAFSLADPFATTSPVNSNRVQLGNDTWPSANLKRLKHFNQQV